jgi:hypothetical protein
MELLTSDQQAESLLENQLDHATGLAFSSPTPRQELFLRRQHRWRNDLTQQAASELIGARLAELQARRRQRGALAFSLTHKLQNAGDMAKPDLDRFILAAGREQGVDIVDVLRRQKEPQMVS